MVINETIASGITASTAGVVLVLLWLLFIGLAVLLSLALAAFWIWMIVDCAKRRFRNENDKVAWILVVILTSWIGAIIYYFAVKRKEGKKK